MSCNIIRGISKGCRDNAGGVVEFYIGNYPTGYTSTEWFVESGGTIISISGVTLYKYVPNKNSSNWVENIQSSIENGSIGYEQVVTFVTSRNEADKRNAIKILGQSNMIVIVRDKNERYFLLGAQNGLEITGGNSSSGTQLNDLNGWTLTISGTEPQPAYEVSASIINGLLG